MGKSNIEWTQETWNPTTGCTKVSQGCKNCYAEAWSNRMKKMPVRKYKNGFEFTMHERDLKIPLKWGQPKLIFVNSMSDLFHEKVDPEFLQRVFSVMNDTPRHTYQILTKRIGDVNKHKLNWTPNIWLGTSVENDVVRHRIQQLKKTPAHTKFLSIEPYIGPLFNLELHGIDWVIVGGESGPGCRPMSPEWVELVYNSCRLYDVPFFFKQWGGVMKNLKGRELHGRTYDEMPKAYYQTDYYKKLQTKQNESSSSI